MVVFWTVLVRLGATVTIVVRSQALSTEPLSTEAPRHCRLPRSHPHPAGGRRFSLTLLAGCSPPHSPLALTERTRPRFIILSNNLSNKDIQRYDIFKTLKNVISNLSREKFYVLCNNLTNYHTHCTDMNSYQPQSFRYIQTIVIEFNNFGEYFCIIYTTRWSNRFHHLKLFFYEFSI